MLSLVSMRSSLRISTSLCTADCAMDDLPRGPCPAHKDKEHDDHSLKSRHASRRRNMPTGHGAGRCASCCCIARYPARALTRGLLSPMEPEGPLFLGIRVSTLGACVLVLALVGLAHFGLRWYTHRRVREQERDPPPVDTPRERSARHALFTTSLQLVAPLALILWIVGLHYALSILILDIDHAGLTQYGLPALNSLRGVAIIVALVWLLSRVGHGIEARLLKLSRRT